MARPREFEADAVLERAMEVFWAKGYESTSLEDLCDATSLNRSSLYAAFGDKRALFLETIDRYGDRAVARVTGALSRGLPIRDCLASFLAEMIDQIVAGPGRSGCFIGNCAAEVARHDRTAAAKVRRNLKRVEGAFHDGLARAKTRGELSGGADIGFRIGCYPALSRRENRPIHRFRLARPRRGSAMAVLADGQPWPDGRAEPSFRPLRAGESSLCHGPLFERDKSALCRDRQAS